MKKTVLVFFCAFCEKNRRKDSLSPLHSVQKLILVLVLFSSLFATPSYSQTLTKKITYGFQSQSLQKSLDEIGEISGFRMTYNLKDVAKYTSMSMIKDSRTINTTLNQLLASTNLEYVIKGKNIVIILRSQSPFNNPDSVHKEHVIHGTVTDKSGRPLNGISVRSKNPGRGTTTDENGNYTIQAPTDGILSFSFIGAATLDEAVNDRSVINVIMLEEAKELNQVIVIGYSNKKASEITGSVVQITGEQLLSGVPASRDVYELLKGKVPGLQGGIIRGSSAISSVGPTTPLIVLDGNVLGNIDINNVINPQDIETISVLKDAASTAIYGSRAALGVLVIVTKRGKQGLNVNFSTRDGINTYPHRQRYMSTSQAIDNENRYLGGLYDYAPNALQSLYPTREAYIAAVRNYTDADVLNNTDWNKRLHQPANFTDQNLNFSSGTEQARIYGSVGWYREAGAALGTTGDRKSVRINSDFKVSPKLSVNLSGSVVIGTDVSLNANLDPLSYAPWLSPMDANGNLTPTLTIEQGNTYSPLSTLIVPNALYEKQNYTNTQRYANENYIGSFTVKYQPTTFLTLQSSNNIYHNISNLNSYYDPRSYSGRLGVYSSYFDFIPFYPGVNANGTLDLSNNVTNTYTTSNSIRFHQEYRLHEVTAFAGQEYSRTSGTTNNISYYNLLPGERNAGAATAIGNASVYADGLPYTPSGSATDYGMFSVFGEASYRYNQRYTLTGSVRTDASASFGANNRYGTFYSLSGAWQIDREQFMQNLKNVVNSLKLRYAYGTSGRDLGATYLNQTFYSNTSSYGNVSRSGSVISQLSNPNIKWETTYNHSLGIDFGLLNIISGSIDLYNKRSSGLIQAVTLPATQGGYTQQSNIGEVSNKGIEVSLRADIIKNKDFNWNISGNFTYNNNKINKLSTAARTFYLQVGDAINDIRKIPYVGVNPANGAPLFKMGNGTTTEGLTSTSANDTLNMVKIGNTTPKYYGGFSSSWSYKGFKLITDWYFELGQLVNNAQQFYNAGNPSTAYGNGGNSYVMPAAWKVWIGPGDTNANMPNIYDGSSGYWYFYSGSNSAFYQNGSYLRLRNVRLSYDFKPKLLTKLSLKNVSVYFNADNVFVITKKSLWQDSESVNNPLRLVLGLDINF